MARIHIPRIAPSEITPESVWRSRREWLRQMGMGAVALGAASVPGLPRAATQEKPALPATPNPQYWLSEKPTPETDVTGYNNFYEFGTGKADPRDRSGRFQTRPWTVAVEGEVAKPRSFDIDDLLKLAPMEERIYRLRCVEAWSMVIPWTGYSLSVLLNRVQPTSKAKFVEFTTATQPESMPGLRSRILDWPYVEGLRIDEAMHPLTMLVFGVYGKVLPNQNGAPLRVAIPWKYGFKSGKSIVRIRLLEEAPQTSWVKAAPNEYGFFANVNPEVDHPRWSQATERRIGTSFLAPRVETLMFNGYGEQVAALYQGMDLSRYY
ncbi:protein-methionine-sulfoxide reductase catalytic subunit MsrP [Parapusillimonas granuli]|uniref:Protein-methionine-sulfoxide reductase catalytic subunit MsrP n=1 Tax=Parapusillimonas granuli TaxID=380911 RepID=A0A853G601_9BURK|nr:protein-methionine-sulfoxide reductase catalytic subunit MsrP [Parapusillimonas granuli]MBB5216759.1 sulfoxide reductase catalytic subunit YedY [Parapusillimonas granuli]MEB2400088.1 protein-methionine-sulfoxide reductase catalytic subunit MsrP [Alcaligenaceae bacterium]NYT51597.1 protein-methionine-sulfoxide reductase catalytic subunit MsrP [Parapusillimonas granuli]